MGGTYPGGSKSEHVVRAAERDQQRTGPDRCESRSDNWQMLSEHEVLALEI